MIGAFITRLNGVVVCGARRKTGFGIAGIILPATVGVCRGIMEVIFHTGRIDSRCRCHSDACCIYTNGHNSKSYGVRNGGVPLWRRPWGIPGVPRGSSPGNPPSRGHAPGGMVHWHVLVYGEYVSQQGPRETWAATQRVRSAIVDLRAIRVEITDGIREARKPTSSHASRGGRSSPRPPAYQAPEWGSESRQDNAKT